MENSGAFSDAEFDSFRERSISQEQASAQINKVKERLTQFLTSKGIILQFPENPNNDEVVEISKNKTEVLSLSAMIAYQEMVNDYRGTSQPKIPDYKKKLQANLLVSGFSQPWLELIDQELEGESLKEDDFDIISEVALETFAGEEASRQKLESTYDEMESYVLQYKADITDDEHIVLIQLTILYAVSMKGIGPSARLEDARNLILNNNLTDPAWFDLLDRYFNIT